jgi:multiple antibiotic resistance protein
MLAVVLLTQRELYTIDELIVTTLLVLAVVGASFVLMLCATPITRVIGEGGASVVSRVMGMILAAVAATQVLEGIKLYFAPSSG